MPSHNIDGGILYLINNRLQLDIAIGSSITESGNYYFTTIDELTQLATLHTGKDTSKIKSAKKLAMPVGRNFDDPIIPFYFFKSMLQLHLVYK